MRPTYPPHQVQIQANSITTPYALLAGLQSEVVVYSGLVDKPRNRVVGPLGKKRLVVITTSALYILDATMKRCRQRTQVDAIEKVITSSTVPQVAFCVPQVGSFIAST